MAYHINEISQRNIQPSGGSSVSPRINGVAENQPMSQCGQYLRRRINRNFGISASKENGGYQRVENWRRRGRKKAYRASINNLLQPSAIAGIASAAGLRVAFFSYLRSAAKQHQPFSASALSALAAVGWISQPAAESQLQRQLLYARNQRSA